MKRISFRRFQPFSKEDGDRLGVRLLEFIINDHHKLNHRIDDVTHRIEKAREENMRLLLEIHELLVKKDVILDAVR